MRHISITKRKHLQAMKKVFFVLFSTLFFVHLSARTLYTSGIGAGEWADAQSWSLDPDQFVPTEIPVASDNIVILHTLTHYIGEGYTHSGNISVAKTGAYEIFGAFESTQSYEFTGSLMQVEGMLLVSGNFRLNSSNGRLVLSDASLAFFGRDLTLENGRAEFNNTSCGTAEVSGTLALPGASMELAGNGSLVAANLRVWDVTGREIMSSEARIAASKRIAQGFKLFDSSSNCEIGEPVVRGTAQFDSPELAPSSPEVFPNPATAGLVFVRHTGLEPGAYVSLDIRSLTGQSLAAYKGYAGDGGRFQTRLDFDLNPGMYMVVLVSGGRQYSSALQVY
ncbi:MAG: T9SS C-terminal target domain-containing protein [Bacteroidetes bacterium]|nr:MAG: T9SS C-terminal target domain-containing protein [Bacteroidota bacterium]